jgi:hypothetical protein
LNDFNVAGTELPCGISQLRLPPEYLALKMGLINRSIDRSVGGRIQTASNHMTRDRKTQKHERTFFVSCFVDPIGR